MLRIEVAEKGKPSKEAMTASLRILARIIARQILEDKATAEKDWKHDGEEDEGLGGSVAAPLCRWSRLPGVSGIIHQPRGSWAKAPSVLFGNVVSDASSSPRDRYSFSCICRRECECGLPSPSRTPSTHNPRSRRRESC